MQTNHATLYKNGGRFAESRRRSCFRSFKTQFHKFCRNYCAGTHVHGMHYITDDDSSLFQSLFFTCTATISLVVCSVMINIQLNRFEGNTLTTHIESTAYPVWENPFPAVTICNFNAVYKSNTQHIANILRNHSIDEKSINDFLGNLAKLVNYELSDTFDVETYKRIVKTLENVGYDTEKLMLELSGSCDRLLKKCVWRTREQPCRNLFQVIETTQGFCCSFNYYGVRDYQIENAEKGDVRYFAGAAGPSFGLSVVMSIEEDEYVSPVKPVYGVDVLVHDGENFPDMSLSSSSLMPNQMMILGVKPTALVADPNIRRLDDFQRGCKFQDEGALKWSNIYSYETCLSECKAEAIYELCGCVPFFYPNLNNLRTCTLLDVPCLNRKQQIFNNLVIANILGEENAKKIKKRINDVKICFCLPRCDVVQFENYIDKRTAPQVMGLENKNASILQVYYNTVLIMKMSTSLYITWDMLLASIGGIFGLCLGGSVMSVVEISYHLTTCFLCDGVQVKKNYNKQKKKIDVKFAGHNFPKGNPKFISLLNAAEEGQINSKSVEEKLEELYKYLSCENIEVDLVQRFVKENDGILSAVSREHRGKNILQIACSNLAKNISEERNLQIFGTLITEENLFYSNKTEDCREAIHYAALTGKACILEKIIGVIKEKDLNKINATTSSGDTALILILRDRPHKSFECVEVLLNAGVDTDVASNDNGTAILMVCKKMENYMNIRDDNHEGRNEVIKILKLLINRNCDVDSHRFYSKTARDHLKKHRRLLADIVLPPEKTPDENSTDYLFGLLKEGRQNEFLSHPLLSTHPNLKNATITLLQLACVNGYKSCVQKLLELRANANTKTAKNGRPLELAGKEGYFEIFQMLLARSNFDASNLLLEISKNLYRRQNDKVNHEKCLEMLLNCKKIKCDVNRKDDEGSTPLHCSTKMRKPVASLKLLKAGALLSEKNNDGDMPVNYIDISTLELYFDYCINYKRPRLYNNPWLTEEEKTAQKQIEIDYTSILPAKDDSSHIEVITQISKKPNLNPALKHPYISSFLFLKWYRIRRVHYVNLIAYTVYCLLLYGHIFTNYLNKSESFVCVSIFLGIITLGLVFREIMQITSRTKHYIYDFENWMEIILFSITFFTLLYWPPNLSTRKQLAALAIILSALELVLSLGQLPELSTNVKMLKTVSWNFIKFILWHFILLFGFALSFYILFNDAASVENPENGELDFFQSLSLSIVKAVVMLTGEYDAASIHFQLYPITSVLIFLMFIFMISMVVFNLLNALAVSDIQEIKQQAEIVANRSRLNYALTLESLFEKIFRNSESYKKRRFKFVHDYFLEIIYSNSKYIKNGKVLLNENGDFLRQKVTEAAAPYSRRWLWKLLGFEAHLDTETFDKIKQLVEVTKMEEKHSFEHEVARKQRDLEDKLKVILSDVKKTEERLSAAIENEGVKIRKLIESISTTQQAKQE